MIDVVQTIFENLRSGDISEKAGIKLLKLLKENKSHGTQQDIAIIGMSSRFPQAENKMQFMENVKKGRDCISNLPLNRNHDLEAYLDFLGQDNPGCVKGGYLSSIDKFDYRFFKLSPKEASLMDPNQRLFLQAAWEAIEDAGYGGNMLAGSKTGVYAGYGDDSYYKKFIQSVDEESLSMATAGNIKPIIASRIAFLLDLKGPSMLVDTACSSALVALHIACQAIRNGECDKALVGGVKVTLMPLRGGPSLGIESPDFRIKTFDDNSDGITWGEGVAVVLIKPLDQALKDGDNIYAVIKGSAVNNDGKTIGLTAPSTEMQEQVLVQAWENAKIDPQELSYIEAHGTATRLGDPIEMEAIQRAFRRYTNKRQFCAVGSVKTSIGHLDHASGMASLISTVLAIKYGFFSRSLHFHRPNRNIGFINSPVYVNSMPRQWNASNRRRLCGISAFGLSGTNCHIVLEELPCVNRTEQGENKNYLIFTLSACSLNALKEYIKKYVECLLSKDFHDQQKRIEDICFTASTGRGHYSYRMAFSVENMDDLKRKLIYANSVEVDKFMDEGIFYGYHNVVIHNKEDKHEGSISIEDKVSIDKKADILIDTYVANNGSVDETWMNKLCSIYIKGADIAWKRFYDELQVKRVALPTYPFEQLRCWPNIATDEKSYDDYFHSLVWRKKENNCSWLENKKEGCTLLIHNGAARSMQLLKGMEQGGKQVIDAVWGDKFTKLNDKAYEIECSQQGMAELLHNLKNQEISTIVYFKMQCETLKTNDAYSDIGGIEKGIHSLRYLVKSLVHNGNTNDIEIFIVGEYANEVDGSEEQIIPENAALFGFAKIIPMEHLNLKCKCIDIDDTTSSDEILEELKVNGTENKVAYRHHDRFVEELDICDISQLESTNIRVREKGVYLITGGRGRIGLEIAEYLALHGAKNLILVNRSQFPHKNEWDRVIEQQTNHEVCEIIDRLKNIENMGINVQCYSIDISNAHELEKMLKDIRSNFGKISGVIHSAGLGFGRVGPRILDDDKQQFDIEISPKIQGTWLLDHMTRQDNLDFMVLFSSPITVVGGVGVGSYIAANAYQSAYAQFRNRSGYNTLSVSWAPWYHTIQKLGENFVSEQQLFCPLSNFHALSCFEKVLTKKTNEVIIGQMNYMSNLFILDDLLTFSYSDRIGANIQKKADNSYQADKQNYQLADVVLCGHENAQYSYNEKKIGQVWANVFGVDSVHVDDNFYEIGGDSIIAVTLVNLLNKVMGIKVPVIDVLKYPVFSAFVNEVEMKYLSEDIPWDINKPIERIDSREFYEVSSAQKQMFVIHRLQNPNTSYNEPVVMIIDGLLDKDRLQEVFDKLIQRHEVLRTSFHLIEGKPMQKIHDIKHLAIEYHTVQNDDIEEIAKKFIEPFDLSEAPLLRVHLVDLYSGRYMLFLDMHHIISDGISTKILIKEFMDLYQGMDIEPLKIQYRDYAYWHNKLLESPYLKKQEEFWLNLFNDEIPILNMPVDFSRKQEGISAGATVVMDVNRELSLALKEFAAHSNTTVFIVLLSVLNILFKKYTGQEDIVVGSPVSGRRNPDLDNVIGFVVNSVAFRNYPKGEISYTDFLKDVNQRALEVYDNQDYPFEVLTEKLISNRDFNRNPLFDVLLVLQKFGSGSSSFDNMKVEQYFVDTGCAKFDLIVDVHEYEDIFKLEFEYSASIYLRQTIERLMRHFIHILEACIEFPETKISDIQMLDNAEREEILSGFNHSAHDPEIYKMVPIQLFEKQVYETPKNIALVLDDCQLTYFELNGKANILASKLKGQEIGSNHVIGILLHNQADMIISILAIMKAGAAFIVLDGRLSQGSLKEIIYDANPTLILTSRNSFESTLLTAETNFMYVSDEVKVIEEDTANFVPDSGINDLAYITYTSGSTGQPKGVLVQNRSLANQILAAKVDVPYDQYTNHILMSEFSFDLFVYEMFAILTSGGCLHLIHRELKTDAERYISYLKEHHITSLNMLPSLMNRYLTYLEETNQKVPVRIVTLAGETFTKSLCARIFKHFEVEMLFNIYGSAETVINAGVFLCNRELTETVIPIGKPTQNYLAYILDAHLQPVPVNVPGELFISGSTLASGYINNPEETSEKFVSNPFVKGMTMYRTGDIVKWLPDGNIVFIGRKDNMAEIRGMRIETNEIKKSIQSYINTGLVEVTYFKDEDESYLCAYIVRRPGFDIKALKEHMSNELPNYMIPAYFVYIDELPVNLNGKVDINQLPHPKKTMPIEEKQLIPENPLKKKLQNIWSEILGISKENIGTDKSFFDLGGSSLSIILLHSKLEKELHRSIPILELFSRYTIDAFAQLIQQKDQDKISLQYMKFPFDYFREETSGQERGYFEFTVPVSQLNQLSQVADASNASIRDVFVQLFGYLLADLCGIKQVEIPVIVSRENDVIRQIPIDTSHTKPEDIISYNKWDSYEDNEVWKSFDIDRITLVGKDKDTILPCYMVKDSLFPSQEHGELFNLIFHEERQPDNILFTVEYDSQLRRERVYEFIQLYINCLDIITDGSCDDSNR